MFWDWHPSRNRLSSAAYSAKPRYAASLQNALVPGLLTTVKYKIDNNSNTENRTKKLRNTITPIITLCIFWDQDHLWKKMTLGKKNFGFLFNTKMTRIDYISKTKNHTKKNQLCKKRASSQFQSTLQTFEESWIFGRPKRPFCTRYEVLRPPFIGGS